jgi:hypothetical protein
MRMVAMMLHILNAAIVSANENPLQFLNVKPPFPQIKNNFIRAIFI